MPARLRYFKLNFFWLVALIIMPCFCSAETSTNLPSATNPTNRISGHDITLRSKVLDEDRPISIILPSEYSVTSHSYPVIYVLDGGAYDSYVVETIKLMAFQREIPQMIVVGIASINRTYDLTPFQFPDDTGTGGAKKFLEFLKTELIPFIDNEYRTEEFNILFGHSFGGSFTVFSLFSEPDLFQAGLAISPALYSDRGRLLRMVEKSLQTNRAYPTNFLYMSIGNELGYTESLDFLTDKLKEHPPSGLRWEAEKFPEESHSSIVLRTLVNSLRALFYNWPLKISELQEGYETVALHYQELSKTLGYEVKIPENMANNIGYKALGIGDFVRARLIFQNNVRNYPGSANVHDSLAEVFYEEGNLKKALLGYRKSLELDPDNENAQKMIDRILDQNK